MILASWAAYHWEVMESYRDALRATSSTDLGVDSFGQTRRDLAIASQLSFCSCWNQSGPHSGLYRITKVGHPVRLI